MRIEPSAPENLSQILYLCDFFTLFGSYDEEILLLDAIG
jgi:hypothetical protein